MDESEKARKKPADTLIKEGKALQELEEAGREAEQADRRSFHWTLALAVIGFSVGLWLMTR